MSGEIVATIIDTTTSALFYAAVLPHYPHECVSLFYLIRAKIVLSALRYLRRHRHLLSALHFDLGSTSSHTEDSAGERTTLIRIHTHRRTYARADTDGRNSRADGAVDISTLIDVAVVTFLLTSATVVATNRQTNCPHSRPSERASDQRRLTTTSGVGRRLDNSPQTGDIREKRSSS